MKVTLMMDLNVYSTIVSKIQISLGQGSGWIIGSVIDNSINISKYNPLAGSSYIKLPKELEHPKKDLINIQNMGDNEYFKWCLVKRVTKVDKTFAKRLNFKDIKFPVKTRGIHKIEKKNSMNISVLVMKSMYQKNVVKNNMLIYY